jgi:hypothetical protein
MVGVRETSEVDASALDGDGEVSVLHHIFLAGVDFAEDFHHAEDAFEDRHADADGVEHVAVDADADGGVVDAGLDVEVGGAGAEACEEDESEDADGFA